MLLALNSLKLSAQSPPCRRNALPMAASASRSSRFLASPANTIGGNVSRVLSTDSSSSSFGYSGSWSAFLVLQLSTLHFTGTALWVVLAVVGVACCFGGLSETTGFLAGSAAWTAEIEGSDLRLEGMEGWWGLVEGRREDWV